MDTLQSHAHNVKIFLIDDSEPTRDVIKEILLEEGYSDIHTFGNPLEALNSLKDYRGNAIIISDFNMPIINGADLLDKLLKTNPSYTGIIITSDPQTALEYNPVYPIIEKGTSFFSDLLEHLQTCPTH